MRYGIGIDTGGTYTDAVIFDFVDRKILSSAKSLTTKSDLSVGIKKALDGLNSDNLDKVDIVALSTTLATNACVENKGGRAKLLFIGVDRGVIQRLGGISGLTDIDQIYFLDAETTITGEIIREPDWDTFLRDSRNWIADAEALGIVEVHAMKNGGVLEKKAKQLIREHYNIPSVCGYELFSDLNSIIRGSSVLLNGRLIPVLAEFLDSIKKALSERGINAPVAIVRSDGSLMSEEFTGVRPVETVLCGPAASVIGGMYMADVNNAVIADMGGTTTDIALVRDGRPVMAKGGINIGSWRTFVKGFFVETIGLGGDSAVRFDRTGLMYLDSVRVVPLCSAAAQYPSMVDRLRRLLQETVSHSRLAHEFYILVKDIENSTLHTPIEKDFCRALKNGPLILSDAAESIGMDIYSIDVSRLEREGIVIRSGLTPTDIMHIKGDFTLFDKTASELGAQFVANSCRTSFDDVCDRVYDMVKRRLYVSIAGILLEENMPSADRSPEETKAILERAWDMSQGRHCGNLEIGFKTKSTLVGVGAPIHIFLPDVAKAMGTDYIIPEHAEVINALGAVASDITAVKTVKISPTQDGIMVYGPESTLRFEDMDEAVAAARREAEAAARAEAVRRGARGEIIVNVTVNPVMIRNGHGSEYLVEDSVVATAVGKLS